MTRCLRNLKTTEEDSMHHIQSRTLGIAGLVLLFGNGLSWAGGPPNPTASDANQNTAGGTNALFDNTTGINNIAFGFEALLFNTTGDDNTASGSEALLNNTAGDAGGQSGSVRQSLSSGA
jgi:hypothetical protein